MSSCTAVAPAKINLQLAVGARAADGWHEVSTLYHAVSLYEQVTATPADELSVTVDGRHAETVPLDESNLALRAARLLAEAADVPARAAIHIRKAVPVAGGMAGGSADAAAALLACNALWDTQFSPEALRALAASLGSDVPFALMGGNAVGTGRGERLSSALAGGEFHWVLGIAGFGLSTPQVYAELDRLRSEDITPSPRVSGALMSALRAGDPRALGAALSNDLQQAACSLRPGLRRTLEAGERHGALASLVSGSGPTCVFLASDEVHADELAAALEASDMCRTVLCVHGPVGGARVITGNESATGSLEDRA